MAIGGGTGLPNVLKSLKPLTEDITAVVTVADDGGSSGRLREELGILPPGDVRNCLVALVKSPSPLGELFQYRFERGAGLAEHSLGNLILAALADQSGGFAEGIAVAARLLDIQGQVLPATLDDVTMVAQVKGGARVVGQAKIARTPDLDFVALEPSGARAYGPALEAIARADLITVGPGSLFTSVIPNLLVEGIKEACLASKGNCVYIVNTMHQWAETTGFTATDHLEAVLRHSAPDLIDTVLVADLSAHEGALADYEKKGFPPVSWGRKDLESHGVEVLATDLADAQNLLHHSPEKLGRVLKALLVSSEQ